jgi:ribosome-binding factor A
MAILQDLKDPRVQDVTVTYVEVSGDLRNAKVHVSVMGNETKQKLSLRGLQNAAGFLQSKLNSRIDTRYTPRLDFVLDQGVKKSIAIAQILDRVLPGPPVADGEEDETEAEQGVEEEEADGREQAESGKGESEET